MLARQIKLQKEHAWDLEGGIRWDLGIDTSKYFLPIDDWAIAFPGASPEQQLALSQFTGLVINATISEVEDAIPRIKQCAWRQILNDYPANPELTELGELFFEEEAKHSRAFARYLDLFCGEVGCDRKDLDKLMPTVFGSWFQKSITANAVAGGHAFWWVVASVEEVSIAIYEPIHKHRKLVDPLYYELHRKHLEEEMRHANYALLMLDLIERRSPSWRRLLHKKVDFAFAQFAGMPWVLSELYKFFGVKKLKGVHPFFDTLASCIPLFEQAPKTELLKRMFFVTPYISWFLNPAWRASHRKFARKHGAIVPPFPAPEDVALHATPIAHDASDKTG